MKVSYTKTLFTGEPHGKYRTSLNKLHNLPFYFLIIYELEEGKKETHKFIISLIYLKKQSNFFSKYQQYLDRPTQVLTLSKPELPLYGLCPSQNTNFVNKAWIPPSVAVLSTIKGNNTSM